MSLPSRLIRIAITNDGDKADDHSICDYTLFKQEGEKTIIYSKEYIIEEVLTSTTYSLKPLIPSSNFSFELVSPNGLTEFERTYSPEEYVQKEERKGEFVFQMEDGLVLKLNLSANEGGLEKI